MEHTTCMYRHITSSGIKDDFEEEKRTLLNTEQSNTLFLSTADVSLPKIDGGKFGKRDTYL